MLNTKWDYFQVRSPLFHPSLCKVGPFSWFGPQMGMKLKFPADPCTYRTQYSEFVVCMEREIPSLLFFLGPCSVVSEDSTILVAVGIFVQKVRIHSKQRSEQATIATSSTVGRSVLLIELSVIVR